MQAIYTLSFCGTPDQMKRIASLHNKRQYIGTCLYAHAVAVALELIHGEALNVEEEKYLLTKLEEKNLM